MVVLLSFPLMVLGVLIEDILWLACLCFSGMYAYTITDIPISPVFHRLVSLVVFK